MPKATTRIVHRPLSERDQKAKDDRRVFERGDDVPDEIAKDAPGAVATTRTSVDAGDVTSEEAVRRSITHAPDHPERPRDIPGVDDWKVTKTGAFAGEPVTRPEDKAEVRAELRRDAAPAETPAPAPRPAAATRPTPAAPPARTEPKK